MKVASAKVCIPVALLLLAGCNNSGKKVANNAAGVDSVAAVVEPQMEAQPQGVIADTEAESALVEQAQMAMLQELLSVDAGANEDMLHKCCTKKALKQLHDAYEYDDFNENSLAVWDINGRPYSDLQMEPASITKMGQDTYQVEFKVISGEQVGSSVMEYKLTDEDGQWKIDSYKQISFTDPS